MTSKQAFQSLFKREEGSYSIEASMVFPSLFFALIALVMLSMYTYQKVVVYHAASLIAERTAFRWDNSSRDPSSGIGKTGDYDGLYWRLTDNGALQELFGFTGDGSPGNAGTRVVLGPSEGEGAAANSSLPMRKMSSEARRIDAPFQGAMTYGGSLVKRIEVMLRQPLSIPPLEKLLGHSEPRAVSKATIVDPVEFIRSVDLVRYYEAKFTGDNGGEKRKQAKLILGERQRLDDH